MAQITVTTAQLSALTGFLRGFLRLLRRLAFAAVAGAVLLAAVLARGGFSGGDAVVTALLLAPPAILLFFAQGVGALIALPERLWRTPGEDGQTIGELTRFAGEAQETRLSGMPSMLWRLRDTIGSRDIAGAALKLRVLTPSFLGLTAIAALFCIVLTGVGVIALVLLALG
jgi:hypothetical protein